MKILRDIFDNWLMRAAGIVFILMVAITIFNVFSNLTERHPLLGVLLFSLVPILFVVGGIIFVLAIIQQTCGQNGDKE